MLSFVKLYTCKMLLMTAGVGTEISYKNFQSRCFILNSNLINLTDESLNSFFSNLFFANFKSSLRRAGVYQRPSYMCTIVELHWRPRYLTCLPFAFFLSFLFLKFTCKKSSLLRVILIYLSANKLENRIHQ